MQKENLSSLSKNPGDEKKPFSCSRVPPALRAPLSASTQTSGCFNNTYFKEAVPHTIKNQNHFKLGTNAGIINYSRDVRRI